MTCTGELSKKTIAYWRAKQCVTEHGRLLSAPCAVDKVDGFIFANILAR